MHFLLYKLNMDNTNNKHIMFYDELCSVFQKTSFYNELYTVRLGAILGPFWHREESIPEPSRAGPGRAEPRRAEPSQAKPSRAEPSRSEPTPCRAETSRAEPSRAEPGRAGPPTGPQRTYVLTKRKGPAGTEIKNSFQRHFLGELFEF